MTAMMQTFGLDKLNRLERLSLLQEIWTSLDGRDETLLTAEHHRDLHERLAKYENQPLAGSPWDEVKARLLNSSMP
jgi:putative addiction module component (TIGR02574 family)